MDALISGRAGLAILFDGERIESLRHGSVDPVPLEPIQLTALLRRTANFELVTGLSREEVASRLRMARRRDLAFELILALHDPKLPADVRQDAATELDEFVHEPDIVISLEQILFAHPLPSESDNSGAIAASEIVAAPLVSGFCRRLSLRQPQIVEVRRSWELVPLDEFGGEKEFRLWQAAAVRLGLFRQLVFCRVQLEDPQQFFMKACSRPEVQELPRYRQILSLWIHPLNDEKARSVGESAVSETGPHVDSRYSQATVAEPVSEYGSTKQINAMRFGLSHSRIQYAECAFRLDEEIRRALEQEEDPYSQIHRQLSVEERLGSERYFRGLTSIDEEDQGTAIDDLAVAAFSRFGASAEIHADVGGPVGVASTLIQMFSITDPREIDLEAIAMARGVLVVDSHLRGSEARLVRGRNGGVIRLRHDLRDLGRGRRRFALAHELGHWELHSGDTQGYFCSERDIGEYRGSGLEVDANTFAAELLMPGTIFGPRCRLGVPSIQRIRELANEFGCSLTATSVRFVEECHFQCIVVFSEGGSVTWWRDAHSRQEGLGRKYWIPREHRVQEGTDAWKCHQGEKSFGSMRSVDPSLWLIDSSADSQIELREESYRLGSYPIVMTLLWIEESPSAAGEEDARVA